MVRRRVRMPYVEQLTERLSLRDWSKLSARFIEYILSTGIQLERLHFTNLAGRSRSVMRSQVLKRLVDARVLVRLSVASAPHTTALASCATRSTRLVNACSSYGSIAKHRTFGCAVHGFPVIASSRTRLQSPSYTSRS